MIRENALETQRPVHIEQMRETDVEEVAELDKKCFPSPWSASAYRNEVHNPSAYYIVARMDDRIIGYAGMWLIMDEAHITTIGVDPEFRGKGLGERILVSLLEEALHRGARRATLEVRKSNIVAQNLYHKYCFHAVAVRRGYYTNNGEDAIVMWVDDMWGEEFLKTLRKHREELNGVS
ncbi:MAG: ribosomal protein S18-alanine N-acetyltransferase [Armatimonadota bacterium]